MNFETSTDIFQRGAFHLVQPKKGAHRAGLDALLLASALPQGFEGHAVDLGAGAGAIGFAVAARHKAAKVTLIENAPDMLYCAQEGISLKENIGFSERLQLVDANINGGMASLEKAGLTASHYDAVLTNPPYNPPGMQQSDFDNRAKAHQMDEALFERWFKTSTSLLKPGGFFASIVRPETLDQALKALERRFGDIKLWPIHPRERLPAHRLVITAKKNSRAPLTIAPSIYLHDEATRAYLPAIDALLNGKLSLYQI